MPQLSNDPLRLCFLFADLGGCGVTLSCGQQYCIGLLRALVRHPQVIILDETTSKVDAEVWYAVSRRCGPSMSVCVTKRSLWFFAGRDGAIVTNMDAE